MDAAPTDPPFVPAGPAARPGFLALYLGAVVRNVVGWLLILLALPVGIALPGPGGIPLFFIGFAMISFPGKRRLTARMLRGRPFTRRGRAVWYLRPPNAAMRGLSRARRFIRPWMRRRGVRLLPPRPRRREPGVARDEDQILHIHERHARHARAVWAASKPWLKRLLSLTLVGFILYKLFKPVVLHWDDVRHQVAVVGLSRFALAVAMFSLFLGFRALSWRRILVGFGHRLPYLPAIRVWSFSELARYMPGAIWQVVGRVYLVKPYGVSGVVCSTSQLLELTTFLLANLLVAAASVLWFAQKAAPPEQKVFIFGAMAAVPLLGFVLHPKVFYSGANWILARFKKPPITTRLSGFALFRLLMRMTAALLWQSLAVYILVSPVLNLKIDWWWMLAGSYCLAWCAGFTFGALSPGGIGVRELVFVATMQLVLPQSVKAQFAAPAALLSFLAVMLRVWTMCGELILAGFSLVADYRGARGRPDAPGREAWRAGNTVVK